MIYHSCRKVSDYNLFKCGIYLPNTDFCIVGKYTLKCLEMWDVSWTLRIFCRQRFSLEGATFAENCFLSFLAGESWVNQTSSGWENILVNLRSSLLICPVWAHISQLVTYDLDPLDVGNFASVITESGVYILFLWIEMDLRCWTSVGCSAACGGLRKLSES